MLGFLILGPFEVVDVDHAVSLGGPWQRALLAILVLHCGEVVSSDRLSSRRQSDALKAYRRGRQALRGQLCLEPGHELRALEQRILDQDPTLDPAGASARAEPARSPQLRSPDPAHARRRRWPIALSGALLPAAAIAAAVTELAGGSARPFVWPRTPSQASTCTRIGWTPRLGWEPGRTRSPIGHA